MHATPPRHGRRAAAAPRHRPAAASCTCDALEPRRLLADVPVAVAADTTFGVGGRAVADAGPRDAPGDALRLGDGKFLLVGSTGATDNSQLRNLTDGLLARFNRDGSRDATFGDNGVALMPLGAPAGVLRIPAAVPLAGGKVVVAANRILPPPFPGAPIERDIVLARFNADGTPDDTFGPQGSGGQVVIRHGTLSDLALTHDGKILAGGSLPPNTQGFGSFAAIWRFHPDGTRDETFGLNGQWIATRPDAVGLHVGALRPRPDGSTSVLLNGGLALFRPGGSYTPFDPVIRDVFPDSLTPLPDGSLLLARATGTGKFTVNRVLPDGLTLDPAFQNTLVHSPGPDGNTPSGIAVQPDGRIVIAVRVRTNGGYTDYGTLYRLLPDGSPDPSFQNSVVPAEPWVLDGIMYPFVTGNAGGGTDVVVAGSVPAAPGVPYGVHDLMLARYRLDPPLSVNPGGPYGADEGTPFAVAASAAYGGGQVAGYAWDAQYRDRTFTADAAGPAATLTVPDDRSPARVVLRVTTSDGLEALVPVEAAVANVAPRVTRLSVPDLVVKGASTSVWGVFADPGADTWTASFRSSADGISTPATVNSSKTFSATRTFPRGVTTVTATVLDDEGAAGSASATLRSVDILGTVFKDADDDGVYLTPDRPWPGLTVYLDRDDDGVADPAEERSVTDESGRYWFSGLGSVTYSVRLLTTPPGWRYSTAAGARGRATVSSTTGARLNFGLSRQARITGTVFNDINHNGVRDAAEGAVTGPGAFPYADLDNDGRWDPHEPQARADPAAAGKYVIANLAPGTYTVRFAVGASSIHEATGPAARTGHTVTVGPAEVKGNYDFGRAIHDAVVRGTVFDDVSGDGVRNNNETGSAGWTVYLDADDDGTLDPDEQRTETSAAGDWRIGVTAGPYVVRLLARDGRTQVAPDPSAASGGAFRGFVSSGAQTLLLHFGYRPAGPGGFVGAHLFYDGSAYDLADPVFHPEANDAALVPGKVPLEPGGRGSFANVSAYALGLTGIFVDLRRATLQSLVPEVDYVVRAGRGGASAVWSAVPSYRVSLRPGDGAGGTDRVEIAFNPNTLRDRWVEVTIAANARTALGEPRRFYFGHLTGNVVGGGASDLAVDARDLAAVLRRAQTFGDAAITKTGVIDPMDVNADGVVDTADVKIVRANLGRRLAPLTSAPAAPAAGPAPLALRTPTRRATWLLSDDQLHQ